MILPGAPQSAAAVADHYDELDATYRRLADGKLRSGPFNEAETAPNRLRWNPFPIPLMIPRTMSSPTPTSHTFASSAKTSL